MTNLIIQFQDDENKDIILEVCVAVTDKHLNLIEWDNVIIHHPSEDLEIMDDYVRNMHTENGLLDSIPYGKHPYEAVVTILDILEHHIPKNASPMCGNSVGFDRKFLRKYLPEIESYFHYRNIDVSTIKELVKLWDPDTYNTYTKNNIHRAIDDIMASIDELRFYRGNIFNI